VTLEQSRAFPSLSEEKFSVLCLRHSLKAFQLKFKKSTRQEQLPPSVDQEKVRGNPMMMQCHLKVGLIVVLAMTVMCEVKERISRIFPLTRFPLAHFSCLD
jgi:hypothetical protein